MPRWRNLKINNCATRQADVVVNNNSLINISLLLLLLLSLLSSLLLSSSIFKVPVLSTATDIKNPTVTSSTNHNTSPTVVVDAFQYQYQYQYQHQQRPINQTNKRKGWCFVVGTFANESRELFPLASAAREPNCPESWNLSCRGHLP